MTEPLPHDEAEALVVQLEGAATEGSPALLAHIVGEVELGYFADPEHRRRLAPALMRVALAIRGRFSECYTLWAAMRRFASVAPESDIVQLVEFMGPPLDLSTRICALQCVQNAFWMHPPAVVDPTLKNTVEALYVEYGTMLAVRRADVRYSVLLINAAIALTALCPDRIPDVALHIRSLDRYSLVALARSKWKDRIPRCPPEMVERLREGISLLTGEDP